jgi:hypothetical protein
MVELSCAGCTELVGEVALGVAGAEERAEVLAHVEHCAACRAELAAAADVGDALIELMPAVGAPKGLEARTLAALSRAAPDAAPGVTAQPVRFRWRTGARGRRPGLILAVAAALGAIAIALGGWLVGQTTAPGPTTGAPVAAASLVADHQAVGQVLVVAGDRPWISMAVSMGGGDETVECRVVGTGGVPRTVGTFHILDGYGYWAASLPYRLTVHRAELVTPGGRVVASARLAG